MSRVNKYDSSVGDISFVGFRTWGNEYLIVFTPYDQRRWSMFSEILLERRVQSEIGLIIEKQVQLNIRVTGTCHEVIVQIVSFGRNDSCVRNALNVLQSKFMFSFSAILKSNRHILPGI